jgi:hypothetical protein
MTHQRLASADLATLFTEVPRRGVLKGLAGRKSYSVLA